MIRARYRCLPGTLVCLLASLHLAHINLLWSDEDYHLVAAIQILNGRLPYRDFWYDKPPMAALFYTVIGGYAGWPLRILDVAFILACCWLAYKLACAWWGEPEGRTAAILLAFFTTFYLPAATIPFAVDGLLLLPHLAAIYFAKQQRPFLSGVWCAIGLLTNAKGVFVAATCAVWLLGVFPWFAAGLLIPLTAFSFTGAALGLLADAYTQIWKWGLNYAKGSAIPNPIGVAIKRSTDWLAFHAALLGGVFAVSAKQSRDDRFKLSVWFVFSAAALLMGNHFAPRYFFQILPVLVIAAARGVVIAIRQYRCCAIAFLTIVLLIPVVRFGPRYAALIILNLKGRQTTWTDAAMDVDSQRAADIINALKRPGDTLFVWGYRPDVYVYTRLLPPGKFWDSQPLDGVPADRHLQSAQPVSSLALQANRAILTQSQPTFIVDGLGLLNPTLQPQTFPEIANWLRDYRLIAQTKLSRIYRRK